MARRKARRVLARINASNSYHLSGLGSRSQVSYRLPISDPDARLRGIRRASPSSLEGVARHEGRVKCARHSGFSVVGHARQRAALTDSGPVLFVPGAAPFVARYPLTV